MSEVQKYPKLFHIGTQKAGSTYLYNLLEQHPDVCLSELTEINFFSDNFDKGFYYYAGLFNGKMEAIDMTPKYFMLADTVVPRIKNYSDKYLKQNPRFLLVLRNPIDYLNSHYEMQKIQAPKFGGDDKNKYSLVDYIKRNPGYLRRAKYFEILNIWLEYFSIDNFKIVCFEDLISDKEKTVKKILKFWGLKDLPLNDKKVSKNKLLKYAWLHKLRGIVSKNENIKNSLKNSRIFVFTFDKFLTKESANSLSSEDRLKIRKLLDSDIKNLEKLLDRKFSKWQDFN